MKVRRRYEKALRPSGWVSARISRDPWFRPGWFWTAVDNSGGFGYGLTRYDAVRQCWEQKGWR